ncbi:class F sortase [Streptomyces sp. NPDC046831]|uniref:class F sortase n=1 Tax=Streptomyces sp. NPDC046831 TaxID=3154805 RepID=UPI0033C9426B
MVPRRRSRRPRCGTRPSRIGRTAAVAAVLVTAGYLYGGHHEPTGPLWAAGPRAVAPAGPSPSEGGAGGRRGEAAGPSPTAPSEPPPPPLPRSRATSLRIPSLGIDAPVVGLGLDRNRGLRTPPVDEPRLVGWYRDGPSPGEAGTAVAVGHRDTRTGAAVFAALGQVEPGKHIEARRADGRTAVYTVDKVRVFDKAHFPDKEVYGRSRRPELRLLTCGGLYTRTTGYSSNVVVFAHLTATR